MPPKFKFTRDQIIDAAVSLVRRGGWAALTTRTLADELGASARPIYSFFKSMEELNREVVKRAVDLLRRHMIRKTTGDPWQDHGIGYVLFAFRESRLFRCINDENHIGYFKEYGDIIWDELTASLDSYPLFQGLSDSQVRHIQVMRWLFAHGLAFQASSPPPDVWNEENLAQTVQSGSTALYQGLLKQFASTKKTLKS